MKSKTKLNLEWCIRTCLTTALAACFCLISKSEHVITANGHHPAGLGFTCFIAIVVKDVTLGATVRNGWSFLAGIGVATLLCWLVIVASRNVYSYFSLPLTFILAFCIQYIEFHVLGKKMALCIVALSLLMRKSPIPSYEPYFFYDVVYGTFFALVGNMLPWQKLASTLFEEMQRFVSEVTIYTNFVAIIIYIMCRCYLACLRALLSSGSIAE